MKFTAIVRNEENSYWAEVRELPGCFASGDTLDELVESLEEGIRLYLADGPDALPDGAGSSVAEIEVLIPAA